MSLYRIKMNGKVYEMEIELIEEGKKRIEKAQPVKSKTEEENKPKQAVEINPNTILSPMPGSVIEVASKLGQEVSENEVILVLETMKMENEILAPRAGVIKAIFVSEGQTVASNDPLFEMEG